MCVGTNDVKYFDSSTKDVTKRFRQPLVRLVKLLKLLFPGAQIIFKCVLPMGIMYTYTAKSVHDFNYLLLDICKDFGCIFFDCFSDFLDQWGNCYNNYLYRDRIHLNDIGLRILCRALKFIIYRNVFNPIMRISPSNYYYLGW
ncbi:MAG: SGNH/GDSL hydrolase family protein [Moritella sp.]|nr:SGNH/GDSL hydrolase family protein [Moritella sp.]